jgi:hypothetical protein
MNVLNIIFHTFLFALSSPAFAADVDQFNLKYRYIENNLALCEGDISFTPPSEFLICDVYINSNRVHVRAKIEMASKDQFIISSAVERILPNKEVIAWSKPRITTFIGLPAGAEQNSAAGEGHRLDYTISNLR